MKFLLLYADKNKKFPKATTLEKEFMCDHVSDLNGSKYDVEENSKWSGANAEMLYEFAFGFLQMNTDFVNELWNFDANNRFLDGECKVFLLSDDVDRRRIDWWSLKDDFQIRTLQVSEIELTEALKLKRTSAAIERAHQYTSARHCRDQTLKHYIDHLKNSDISFLKSLDTKEDKIKIRFNKIRERLKNKARRILTKKKL